MADWNLSKIKIMPDQTNGQSLLVPCSTNQHTRP